MEKAARDKRERGEEGKRGDRGQSLSGIGNEGRITEREDIK